MSAASMADCLRRHGVPRDHWPTVSAAVAEFFRAHTADMRAETDRLIEANRRCRCGCPTGNGEA